MCGIIGYIGRRDAAPILVEGLKRLEYRGYDSAGVAAVYKNGNDATLGVSKRPGKIVCLDKQLAQEPLVGTLGIGHTRWATHGEPSERNAHPHCSQGGEFALVHNGIIENH